MNCAARQVNYYCVISHNLRALSCWGKHTHSLSRLSELVLLIEWLLMTQRVNLCLAGSSGCLRGRLIKGNETSWGLSLSRSFSRQTVTDLHSYAFLRVSGTVDTNGPWRDAVAQKGPCVATHVSSGRGMPAFLTDYNLRVYLQTERGRRRRPTFLSYLVSSRDLVL